MTLIVPPEQSWISTLEAPQRRVFRAFLAAGPRPSSFRCGLGSTTPGGAGALRVSGLDLRSYAAATAVVADGDGLPARMRLTGNENVDNPASLFSTPNGLSFSMGQGFGFWVTGVRISAPVTPMRGAVFFGYGVIGEGNVPTARALGFGYDLGNGDTAQWYAQTRANTGGAAATRIPLGSFGMTLTGVETYSWGILVEAGTRVAHVIMYRHDTDQAYGHGFTEADGLPADDVFGYIEPIATSGGEPDDQPLTARTSEFCEIRGYTDGSFMGAT